MNCRVLYRSHPQEAAFFALPSVKHQPHCLNRLILADQSERHALNRCIADQFLDFHSFLKSDCFLIQIKSDFFRLKNKTRHSRRLFQQRQTIRISRSKSSHNAVDSLPHAHSFNRIRKNQIHEKKVDFGSLLIRNQPF